MTEWIRGIFETEQFCSTFPSPHGRVLAFCYCWPFLCLSYPTELRMRAMVNIPSAVFVPHFDRKSPSAQGWRPQFILGRRLLLPGRPYLYDEWNATILDTSSTALRQKRGRRGERGSNSEIFWSNKTGCLVTHCGNFPLGGDWISVAKRKSPACQIKDDGGQCGFSLP